LNCYVCDRLGEPDRDAVAICPNCSIGLCREHHEEEARAVGPGGMRYGCTHERNPS
jgi:hypothetical protein